MPYSFTYSNFRGSTKYQYEYLEVILQLLDSQDHYTYGHSFRVAKLAVCFGKHLNLSEESVQELELAAYFHDIGKTGIPAEILNKKGKLTKKEQTHLCRHAQFGFDIIENITSLNCILPAILYHHEKFDGTGYPAGLLGSEIPVMARLISIVDTYDAMSLDRPYRKKLGFEDVLMQIRDNRGTQFDPRLVDEFCDMIIDNCLIDDFPYSRRSATNSAATKTRINR